MGNTFKSSRRQIILALEVGEETEPFPIASRNSISSECYSYGVAFGRSFSLKTNKEAGTVTVTRKA